MTRRAGPLRLPLLAGLPLAALLLAGCPDLLARFGPQGTGPAGDGFALAPPPAGQGVQIRIGPFDVPEGKELQQNFYMKLAADEDVDVNRVEIAMRDGSHHLNLFKSPTEDVPDKVEATFDAVAFEKYDLFAGNQNRSLDWKLPRSVGMHFKARNQLIIQSHYVNAGTQRTPGKGEALINLWFARPGEVTQRMGTLFANNTRLADNPLAPNSTGSYSMNFTWNRDIHVAALTGHFHSRGKRFTTYTWDGAKAGEMFYQSANWEEPPFKILDGLGLPIASGSGVQFVTEYENRSNVRIGFGPWVDVESTPPEKFKDGVCPCEHANLFLYYYPANPRKELLHSVNRNDTTEETAAAKGG
ncbi:MAG: hypothetical protein FJZ01_21390 [Candidatus Sericytochromatia bacterium]|nr:hypothetical protein [Candidatus Tanganyikabacteria bacterium]